MFFMSAFEKNLENATSHLQLEADWKTILLIGDEIRQNDIPPKQAYLLIRKKMNSPNPHTASYALLVLESIVKNCGSPVHDEVCSHESCEFLTNLIETTPHETVKTKMLELIQAWAYAFRTFDKYQAIKDTHTILRAKGHKFPLLKESDAMFASETAPNWSDGKVCNRCRVTFSFTMRKHHCRHCGQIFCATCSNKTCTLPKFGIEKEVRVCDGCYTSLHGSSAGVARSLASLGGSAESDLPADYLASSLAQQSQSPPPRKSDQELKEEEELQLALALSQSEAEAQKSRGSTSLYRSPSARKATTNEVVSSAPSTLAINTAPIYSAGHSVEAAGEPTTDPELAKYLNRDYWEQRKTLESPASPSAPSPMSHTSSVAPLLKSGPGDVEIDDFSGNLRTQVEIFVNRMRSNSSRGRNIVTDSSVQTLFMSLTSYHSRLLTYIKEMDDKRMWFEQLQDKLAQVKDSRAALDVLRQEHQDKLRLIAEEQERQRQMQMAHKLDIMRKKKQEYLQYQRQLALQRIQEQEREMAMRQEQQKALYQMSSGAVAGVPFGPYPGMAQGSPHHQMMAGGAAAGYGNSGPMYSGYGSPQMMATGQRFGPHDLYAGQAGAQPPMIGHPAAGMHGIQMQPGGLAPQQQPQYAPVAMPPPQHFQPNEAVQPPHMQHHPQQQQLQHHQGQMPPQGLQPPPNQLQQQPLQSIPHQPQQQIPSNDQPQLQAPQNQGNAPLQAPQPQLQPQQQPLPQPIAQQSTMPQPAVEPAKPAEPAEAELISFD